MNASNVANVVAGLQACEDFGAAAEVLLACIANAVEQGRSDASTLRATLHYRPSASYSAMASIARLDGAWVSEDVAGAVGSSTAWLWLARTGRVLEFSLETGEVSGIPSIDQPVAMPGTIDSFAVTETLAQLTERGATHMLAVPLMALRSPALSGMITVEFSARDQAPDRQLWSETAAAIADLVKLSSPWLFALPARPERIEEASRDPHLPVVGQTLAGQLPMLRAFAALRDHLLISGATGVGKSRLARWVHANSRVASGPFESIDFHAIPADMQMAELVGWQKGAFTGATASHAGALDRAAGGTLLIDEIDKLSLAVQAGLLQILESGSYRSLGSSGRPQLSDARVIIGTNADLPTMVRAGTFREDLYYRINVLSIRLEPLAERIDEIGGWARFMVTEIAERAGHTAAVAVTDAAVSALQREPWPGNLRQLNNTLRRSYAIALTQSASELVELDARHVELALEMDPASREDTPANLSGDLQQAADRFVDMVIAQRDDGASSPIDANDLFKGFVLLRALERMDLDTREVYSLLGQEGSVANRNHKRDLRRQMARAMDMLEALGERDSVQRMRALLDQL